MTTIINLLTLSGIGEPLGGRTQLTPAINTLTRLANQSVHNITIVHRAIPWDATYGPVGRGGLNGAAYSRAVAGGIKQLRYQDGQIAAHRQHSVVWGYSGGADTVGDYTDTLTDRTSLIAAGLVADPERPALGEVLYRDRRLITPDGRSTSGVRGSRRPTALIPRQWVADPADIITSCPTNSPIRDIADLTADMGLDLYDRERWARTVATQLLGRRTQQLHRVPAWLQGDVVATFLTAARGVAGYLGNDHVSYGVRRQSNGRTYLDNLAVWTFEQIIREVTA